MRLTAAVAAAGAACLQASKVDTAARLTAEQWVPVPKLVLLPAKPNSTLPDSKKQEKRRRA